MKTHGNIRRFIEDCVRRIRKGYDPDRIVLFGSYASGEPDEDSDVDFLIIKSTTERLFDRQMKVAQLLSDPRRRIPVDVIVLTEEEIKERIRKGDLFLSEIMENGEVLYAKN